MNIEERAKFIYSLYDHQEIDHVFKVMCDEIIQQLAQEVVQVKTNFEEGGELDTDENAEKIMYALIDELADRVKATMRIRVNLAKQVDAKKK